MKNIKSITISIVFDILLAVVGIMLITNPSQGVAFVRTYLGIILILISLIPFWMFKYGEGGSWKDIIKGLLFIAIGLFFLLSQTGSTIAFGIALAIWMGTSTALKFALAYEYKKVFEQTWWYMVVFALVMLAFTIIIIFNLQQTLHLLIMLAGVFMLVEATFGIIQTFFFKRNLPVV